MTDKDDIQEGDIDDVYSSILAEVVALSNHVEPSVIAAILVAQGLSIYRTILSDEEYNSVVDMLSERRAEIYMFETGVLH